MGRGEQKTRPTTETHEGTLKGRARPPRPPRGSRARSIHVYGPIGTLRKKRHACPETDASGDRTPPGDRTRARAGRPLRVTHPSRLRRAGPHLRSATRKTPRSERTRGPGPSRAPPPPPTSTPQPGPVPTSGAGPRAKQTLLRATREEAGPPSPSPGAPGRETLLPAHRGEPAQVGSRSVRLHGRRGTGRCWSTRPGRPRAAIWSAATVTLPRSLQNQSPATAGRP